MNIFKRVLHKMRALYNIEYLLQEQSKALEESIQRVPYTVQYNMRKEYLIQQAFRSSELGVSKERYCEHELVVSMATHGERFYEAYMAIESIMQQTLKPNRIILNVAKDEFEGKPIPPALKLQQKRGLEINYCEDYWSFKKIIPTLRRFPDAVIVTVDDDCLYNPDMLENMVLAHKQDPRAIWGNVVHDITFNNNHKLKSYMDWNMNIDNTDEVSNRHFITSVGGVLYPPHSMHPDVTKEEIFMDICKTNDDVWCYAMMVLAKTPIRKVRTHSHTGEDYLIVDDVQSSGLWHENTNFGEHYCQNDDIIKRVFDKYAIYELIK